MTGLHPFLATPEFHRLIGWLIPPGTVKTPARVLIRGEGGLGKSTYLEQSIGRVADRFALVLRGRSHPLRLAYYPLADAIWSIAETAKHAHTARHLLLDATGELLKLVPVLGPFAPDLTELVGTAPPTLPTAALEPLDVAFHVKKLLRQVAKSKPILLLFDDVHDYDTSTLATIYCLFRDAPKDWAVVIALDPTMVASDDTVRHDFEDQLIEQFGFQPLELHALSQADTSDLAHMILGDRATSDLAVLIQKFTNGHPFFVVEVCRAIQDQSMASERIAEDVNLSLTERLARFVDRRVRHLTAEHQATLNLAAVFGPAFPSIPVAACLGREHVEVLRQLRALETTHRMVYASGPQHYRFAVPAVRERLYALLGRDVTREQHLLIARTLAQSMPGSLWEFEVGRHLLLAGHTQQGLETIRRSATSAAAENRFGDAADRFHRLAAAYTNTSPSDTAARQQALLDSIVCLRQQGNIPAAIALCDRVKSEPTLSPLIEPALAAEDAVLAYYADDFDGCIRKGMTVLREFSNALPFALRTRLRLTMSAALYHTGRWQEARHQYRRCFHDRQIARDPLLLIHALKRVNMFYIAELALPKLEALAGDTRLAEHPDLRFQVLTNIGTNHLMFLDTDAASRYYLEAIDGFDELSSRKQTYPMNNLAICEMLAGRYSSARTKFAALVHDFTEAFESDCARSNEAVCILKLGEVATALRLLEELWERVSRQDSPILEEFVGHNLALALAAVGKRRQAIELIVRTAPSRQHSSLEFERGRRHRVVKEIDPSSDVPFLADTAEEHRRLMISGRRDATLYRTTDYQIAELWFWE